MDKAVQTQDQSYCTDCGVIPVSSQGSMCDRCIDSFYQWLRWDEFYSEQELEDRLQTLAREYEYQAVYHIRRF